MQIQSLGAVNRFYAPQLQSQKSGISKPAINTQNQINFGGRPLSPEQMKKVGQIFETMEKCAKDFVVDGIHLETKGIAVARGVSPKGCDVRLVYNSNNIGFPTLYFDGTPKYYTHEFFVHRTSVETPREEVNPEVFEDFLAAFNPTPKA